MYKSKKLVSMILVLAMALSFIPVVSANETYSLSLNPTQQIGGISTADATPESLSINTLIKSTNDNLNTAINGAVGWINTQQNGFLGDYQTGDDWDIFALSRSGNFLDSNATIQYANALKGYIDGVYKKQGKLSLPSDYARIALSINSLGLDATNFNGINLIENIYNNDGMLIQGINGYVYGLLALDSKAYLVPTNALWTRDKIIDKIISFQKAEGYYVVQDAWGVDNDLTAAVICALAPYYNQANVKATVDKALTWLSTNQSQNGGFESWGSENSQTPAQVITALCALNKNPLLDENFIKQGKNLFSNVLSFQNEDGGFDFSPSYPGSNSMATQQVLYSLSALNRLLNAQTKLFDLSDVTTKCDTQLLSALTQNITNAKSKVNDNYTLATLNSLNIAIENAEKITENITKSEFFNCYFSLYDAIANLKESVAIGDGNIIITGSEPVSIEPKTNEIPLNITLNNEADAYLELNAVADSLPSVTAQNGTVTLSVNHNAKVKSGSTNILLTKRQPLTSQVTIDNINALLRTSNLEIDSLSESVTIGDATVFDSFVTLRFAGQSGKKAVYSQGDKYYFISSFASDAQGKNSGKFEYAYNDGQDLIIKTNHLSGYHVFTTKTMNNGGGNNNPSVKTAFISITAQTIGRGTIFAKQSFTIENGETAYSLLVKAIGEHMIETTGSGNSIYIAAIKHNNEWIREMQHGSGSGWMYKVNGDFVQENCYTFKLNTGDSLEWIYTKDIGNDIGGGVGGGNSTINTSPSPSPSPSPSQKPVDNTLKETLNEINLVLSQKESLSEWEIFALAVQGKTVDEKHVSSLLDTVIQTAGEYRKVTDTERTALAITALGKNAHFIGGIDLIEKIYNHNNMKMQGTNGPAYALITLDSNHYQTPENAKWNRESLIESILNAQNEDGGFALDIGKKSDIDVTAMVLQAFSRYQDRETIQTATDKALAYLSAVQDNNGGYTLFDDQNSESISQVIIALSSLGIDPVKDSRFMKNGKNMVDALLTYYGNGAFKHSYNGDADQIATEQGLLALIAYDKLRNDDGSLFDLTITSDEYSDIQIASPWAVEFIKKANDYEIMQGYDNKFNPLGNLTRAEFTAIIARMMNLNTATISNPFSDVSESDWYYNDVLTAYQMGYIKGQSQTEFAPNANLTREEMAVILDRVLQLNSTDIAINDIQTVSSWAQESVKKVFAEGIMQGFEGNFHPKDYVTREMGATVCVRIYEK